MVGKKSMYYVTCREPNTEEVTFMFSVEEEPPTLGFDQVKSIIKQLIDQGILENQKRIVDSVDNHDSVINDQTTWDLALSFDLFPCIHIYPYHENTLNEENNPTITQWKWKLVTHADG